MTGCSYFVCPNCQLEPKAETAFWGSMLICPCCRMWTNWLPTPEDAQEAWDKQVQSVIHSQGYSRWWATHPTCAAHGIAS